MPIAFAAAGFLLAAWLLLLALSPAYRLRFIVRRVAARSAGLAELIGVRLFYPYAYRKDPPRQMVRTLASLLSDADPQVRYLAMAYLFSIAGDGDERRELFAATEGLEDALRRAADDPAPEVAQVALIMLGSLGSDADAEILSRKLASRRASDPVCLGALIGLGRARDPAALDEVVPLTDDPRPAVRRMAIAHLGRYRDERAARRIAELLQSSGDLSRRAALRAVRVHNSEHAGDADFSKVVDPVLLQAAQDASIPAERREEFADCIPGVAPRVLAYESLLLRTGRDTGQAAEDRRTRIADKLGGLGSEAAGAIPALRKVLEDPGTKGKVRSAVADALKRIQGG